MISTTRSTLGAMGLAAVVAGGCFGGGFETDEALLPLARAEGWRADQHDERIDASLELAYDLETAERAWLENAPDESVSSSSSTGPGLYGSLADVDFQTQAVVVWSSGDAGDACANWLANVHTRVSDGDASVHVEIGSNEPRSGVCPAVLKHYRMILAVDRDRLPDPEHLPIDRIEGVSHGIVTAY